MYMSNFVNMLDTPWEEQIETKLQKHGYRWTQEAYNANEKYRYNNGLLAMLKVDRPGGSWNIQTYVFFNDLRYMRIY
jgi:hypothetical protein